MAPKTYCNPIPLPNYPRGRNTLPGNKRETRAHSWRGRIHRDFRETADPTVLWFEGKWYLYPSCGMAWVTEDFATWTHHPLQPADVGYAPTVVAFRGRFLMTACGAPLWIGETPLGPFLKAEAFVTPSGNAPTRWLDPMLFADDDGRLYAYWGLSAPGIFGAELDGEHSHRMITEEKVLFSYDPDHEWERVGDWNEDASKSYIEGPWMQKIGGRYFLTYAAPGTQWRSYGMGA